MNWRSWSVLLLAWGGGVPSARAVELLDVASAGDLLARGRVTVIDVRTADERAAYGVPKGALWVEWQGADRAREFVAAVARVQPDRSVPIAFLCSVGHRSGIAARLVESSGYQHVYDIGSGFNGGTLGPGWLDWGLPVEKHD